MRAKDNKFCDLPEFLTFVDSVPQVTLKKDKIKAIEFDKYEKAKEEMKKEMTAMYEQMAK